MCFCASLCINARASRGVVVCVQETAVPGKTPPTPASSISSCFSSHPSSHTSMPCSPSSLSPSPWQCASLPADILLLFLFPSTFFSYFNPPATVFLISQPSIFYPRLPVTSPPSFCHCLCLFMAALNGFRSIKGTQRSLLASHFGGRIKLCTQGSLALIIK